MFQSNLGGPRPARRMWEYVSQSREWEKNLDPVDSVWEGVSQSREWGKSPIWNGQAAGPPGPSRVACGKNVSQSGEWEKQPNLEQHVGRYVPIWRVGKKHPNPEWAACGKKVTQFGKWKKSAPIWNGQAAGPPGPGRAACGKNVSQSGVGSRWEESDPIRKVGKKCPNLEWAAHWPLALSSPWEEYYPIQRVIGMWETCVLIRSNCGKVQLRALDITIPKAPELQFTL